MLPICEGSLRPELEVWRLTSIALSLATGFGPKYWKILQLWVTTRGSSLDCIGDLHLHSVGQTRSLQLTIGDYHVPTSNIATIISRA